GSMGRTATLVEMRGSSMSPETSTLSASQCRETCSGDVLGSVAVAEDDFPFAPAGDDALAFKQAPVRDRKVGHHRPVQAAAQQQLRAARLIQAVRAEQLELRFGGIAGGTVACRMHGEEFTARHQ